MAVFPMFGGETRAPLSEGEMLVLKEEAEAQVLNHARDRFVKAPQPDQDQTYAMIGAADTYGACSRIEHQFNAENPWEGPGSAEAVFTDHAMKWIAKLREEVRGSLEEARGTIEISIDWTPKDTFLLLVLDGILDR